MLDKKTQVTDLACPGASDATAPKSINNQGDIAGFCWSGGRLRGFVRDKRGHYTFLDFPRADLTEAVGLNDDGQVVGDYRDRQGRFHGFVWEAGRFRTFDVPFPDATRTGPSAINNVGQIVGFYFDNKVTATFPNGHAHGFLYDNGFFRAFDVPGATETLPLDMNDRGQIVGIYADNDMVVQSFLLEEGRFRTFAVPFPGVVLTDVSGINNRGHIVGRYLVNNPDDLVNPFLTTGLSPRRTASPPHIPAGSVAVGGR